MEPVGAILAGGVSRRMGRTKALVEVGGAPMAALVADALFAGGCRDVVLVGGDAAELAPLGLTVVADVYPGAGPLGGVLSALRHFADHRHVVVVACDLPNLDAATVTTLVDAARVHDDADVVVARTARIEPAAAVWQAAAAGAIEELFGGGVRALHEVIGQLNSAEVAIAPASLRNVNRPADVPDH